MIRNGLFFNVLARKLTHFLETWASPTSMHDEEQKLFHELCWWSTRVIHTLIFHICFPDFSQDLHHLYPRIISNSYKIRTSCPGWLQVEILSNAGLRLLPGSIVGYHQILKKIIETGQEEKKARRLWVFVKIINDLISFKNLLILCSCKTINCIFSMNL